MSTITFRVFAFMLAASMFASEPCLAQESQPAAETLADPAAARAAFEKLLGQLGAIQLDVALASADEIAAARNALKSAIDQFHGNMTDGWMAARGMAATDHDYVSFRNACAPRLSGHVVKIGRGQPFPNIAAALPSIRPGTLVWLGEGEFDVAGFGRGFNFHDIAIVGQGQKLTTLTGKYGDNPEFATRLMIDNLRIDCKDSPIIDLRRSGTMFLRDCLVENYNSGAGGSNSLFMKGGMCLLEGCAFDGSKGRAAGRRSGGDAMDFREGFLLYCRQCQFVENSEVVRVAAPASAAFDGCTSLNMAVDAHGLTSFSDGRIIVRDSQSIIDASGGRIPVPIENMTVATDDRAVVEHAAGVQDNANAETKALASELVLDRRLPYWIGLLRHKDPAICALAAKRLANIIDEPIRLPANPPKEGETLTDLGVLFEIEQEYTRLMNWLDDNQSRLRWDATAGKYVIEGPNP